MLRYFLMATLIGASGLGHAQLRWTNIDSLFQPLPKSVHVYKTTALLDGKPNIAYYVSADLTDKDLAFSVDTTLNRRLTPTQFFEKNNHPLLVVNCTFFSFETNQNLNTIIKDGKVVGHNKSIPGKGKDTLQYHHTLNSVIGISNKRKPDIAWVYSDSNSRYAVASQFPFRSFKTGNIHLSQSLLGPFVNDTSYNLSHSKLHKWKMQTAVGGGPVLLQNGTIQITNNEERKFAGKAIEDKHPRTAIGYTKDRKLIILVVQGRFAGLAEGATLTQEANLLREIGCWEAMNLDGGGSSCLLINGKETITPSDKEKQRAIPAAFIIEKRD
jgi:exopolysaccharide biosynthesis protein